jgi:hypothetical protein
MDPTQPQPARLGSPDPDWSANPSEHIWKLEQRRAELEKSNQELADALKQAVAIGLQHKEKVARMREAVTTLMDCAYWRNAPLPDVVSKALAEFP